MAAALEQETADVLARLIRFKTVNPPGNERECQEWLAAYLRDVGAYAEHPGLGYTVRVVGDEVQVTVTASADLPLTVPGAPSSARVSATGSAVVTPD